MQELLRKVNESRKKHRNLNIVLSVLAVLVVGGVLWKLTLPGITMTTDKVYCGKEDHTHTEECEASRKLICGKDEAEGHTHGDGCYTEKSELVCSQKETEGHTHGDNCYTEHSKLVCGLAEDEDHTHGEDCYETVKELTCGKEEMTGHTHGADCYKTVKELTCGKKEAEGHKHNDNCYESKSECGKEEHVHTLECYSDVKADVEDSAKWKKMFKDVKLGDDWGENVLTIAKTQIGYQESKKNYEVAEDGTTLKGYTRYGAWSGKNYIDWDGAFASYVLNYAQVPEKGFPTKPEDMDTVKWMNKLSESKLLGGTDAQPEVGDLVFFKRKVNNAEKNFVGIISKVEKDTDEKITYIKVIEGNYRFEEKDIVKENRYAYTDSSIQAYGLLSVAEKNYKGTDEVEKEETTDETKETEKNSSKKMTVYSNSLVLANGNSTRETGGLDFTNWIESVSIQHRPSWGGNWEDVTSSNPVNKGDQLKFKIDYTIPGGTLSEANPTITYKLPDNFKVIEEKSGDVRNPSGAKLGTYIINKDGTVSITFDKNYVDDNQKGQAIDGYISFESKADDANISDTNTGTIDITFSNKVEVKIDVCNKADLTVEKKELSVNQAAGTVQYQITVRSENGTGDAIILKDVMSNLGLDGNITVDCKGGQYSWNPTDKGFDVTLPKMSRGDTYTITYTAKLPEGHADTVSAKNSVTVQSTDHNKKPIDSSAEVHTGFKPADISKKGQEKNGKIKWTITVNTVKHDISGWTLKDTLIDGNFKGTVTMTDSQGNPTQISLPYTFPENSTDTYTITYETDVSESLGSTTTTNKADLTPPQGGGNGATSGNIPVTTTNNPLKKTADKMTVETDSNGNKIAIIQWRMTIDASKGEIPKGWIFTDELQDGQYFTEEQFNEIKGSIRKALNDSNLNLKYTIEKYNGGKGFQIKFEDALPKGKKFSFTYCATADLGDGLSEMTFRNNSNINDKVVEGNSSITYIPAVRKFDLSNEYGGDTNHNYDDAAMTQDGEVGILKWGIQVTLPKGYEGGDLTVVEKLPEGVDLQYLGIYSNGVFGEKAITQTGSYEVWVWDGKESKPYSIETTQEDQQITIKIPKALTEYENLQNIRFVVRAKIRDEIWADNTKVHAFTNGVEVSSQDQKITGTDDQTQTITNDDSKPVLKKEAGEIKDNIVPYKLVVNPDTKDLLESADKLTLVDTTDKIYTPNYYLSLVPGSVHVYHRLSNGEKGTELSKEEVPYIYEEKPEADDPRWVRYKLTLTIPDNTALIVEYEYKVSAGNQSDGIQYTNTAQIVGIESKVEEKNDSFKITDSSAGATMKGITIFKHDAANAGIALEGARFKLYKYNTNTADYEIVPYNQESEDYVTDRDGYVKFENITYNTAYKLEEIAAPDGYLVKTEPYYFWVKNDKEKDYPVAKPNDFEGEELQEGYTKYFPNEKNKTSIEVDKQWFDLKGNPVDKTSGSISFDLYRISSDSPPSSSGGGVGIPYRVESVYTLGQVFTSGTIAGAVKGSTIEFTIPLNQNVDQYNIPYFLTMGIEDVVANWDYDTNCYVGTAKVTGDEVIFKFPTFKEDDLFNVACKVEPDSGTTEEKGVKYNDKNNGESYTLSAQDKNWKKVIADLPKTGIQNGKTVYYTYYIKEKDGEKYNVQYENNDGIVSGTIIIKNTTTTSEEYELPETGGPGTIPYTTAGLSIMLMAGFMYTLKSRKGGRRFFRN